MRERVEPKEEKGVAPVIIDYYAAEVIHPGDSLRIYLHAKDDDGNIKDIICVLEQVGTTTYTSFTRVKRTQVQDIAGYLLLRTPRDKNLTNDLFTMKVMVRDSQGNKSEPIEFPLRFGREAKLKIPEKWEKVSDYKLGTSSTKIESTFLRSQRGHG
jgi:hypothetical protein